MNTNVMQFAWHCLYLSRLLDSNSALHISETTVASRVIDHEGLLHTHTVQKGFGVCKGHDHEMNRAAQNTLKNDMEPKVLKKLYEQALKKLHVEASQHSDDVAHDEQVEKIIDAYMPSELVAKLGRPVLEGSLVRRLQQSSDTDIDNEMLKRFKREKKQSTKKQLQWELLSA